MILFTFPSQSLYGVSDKHVEYDDDCNDCDDTTAELRSAGDLTTYWWLPRIMHETNLISIATRNIWQIKLYYITNSAIAVANKQSVGEDTVTVTFTAAWRNEESCCVFLSIFAHVREQSLGSNNLLHATK